MAWRGKRSRLVLALAGAGLFGGLSTVAGCVAAIDEGPPADGGASGIGGRRPNTGAGGGGGVAQGMGGGAAPGAGGNGGTGIADAFLPPRIRRLTNAEYDASVQALLGTKATPSTTLAFPPDSWQGSYTLNDAQRVDPVLAKQLDAAAVSLVTEARGNGTLARLAPCTSPTTQGSTCATTFIQSFGKSVYRRALTTDESSALLQVYQVGATSPGTYNDGIDLTVRALLQSAGFLYITELGDSAAAAQADGTILLSPNEIATSLAYTLAAAPPDQALLDAAASGKLATADGREQEARRLIGTTSAQTRMIRLIREWLGIDTFSNIGKDATAYPSFAGVKDSMDAESAGFVKEVLTNGAASVSELLGADWTIADAPLATLYGVTSAGAKRTSLAVVGRRGILNQGAFLSVYAHASESGPVLRGVAVIRRVTCLPLKSPAELNIVVTPPVPDPSKTTRQRFADHAVPGCATCHDSIDSIGFSFEEFDGMGALRTSDSGHPVDSTTTIALGTDFDGSYADSNALAAALAASKQVEACFARQLFRGAAGRSDTSVTPIEDAFVQNAWSQLAEGSKGNAIETLIAFVRSPQFIKRSPAP